MGPTRGQTYSRSRRRTLALCLVIRLSTNDDANGELYLPSLFHMTLFLPSTWTFYLSCVSLSISRSHAVCVPKACQGPGGPSEAAKGHKFGPQKGPRGPFGAKFGWGLAFWVEQVSKKSENFRGGSLWSCGSRTLASGGGPHAWGRGGVPRVGRGVPNDFF